MIIIVADDHLPSRELMRELLEADGHFVLEAADGVEAIDLLPGTRPDIVFLDLQMPLLDGFGVLSELRKPGSFGHPPVVAVSASAMLGDRERAIKAGFDSYIAKPFELDEVRKQIESLGGGREFRRDLPTGFRVNVENSAIDEGDAGQLRLRAPASS
jgi:CheY-like chemotaxis protein